MSSSPMPVSHGVELEQDTVDCRDAASPGNGLSEESLPHLQSEICLEGLCLPGWDGELCACTVPLLHTRFVTAVPSKPWGQDSFRINTAQSETQSARCYLHEISKLCLIFWLVKGAQSLWL